MEARSAWCAFEGRIIRRVVPLVCSFVCYAFSSILLAHANCTPFFSPKHLDFVTEKNSFFCHLQNTVFRTLPKMHFSSGLPIFCCF